MALSPAEVKKLAHLCRLEFSESEIPPFTDKLSTILNMVAQMEMVDTAQIEPMSHPLDLQQRLREDHVTAHNQREAFQLIAPLVLAGLYLVPQVIE